MAEEKAVIPRFNGKLEAFLIWWTRFKNYAMAKQFGQAVNDIPEADLPAAWNMVLNMADAGEKQQSDARECNNLACAAIAMAMPNKLVLLVDSAGKTEAAWPTGKACLMVKFLFKKYKDAGTLEAVNARKEIKAVTMHKRDHLDALIEKLVEIRIKYTGMVNLGVTEQTLTTQVIAAAPEAYSAVIAQECIQGAGPLVTLLTLEGLLEVMKTQYAVISKGKWSSRP